jgi:hypothetical protein
MIDYKTGVVQLTFSTPPALGADVTVDYVAGGWMFGTGLMDEDGRHAWVGTNPYCLTLRATGSVEGDTSYLCDGQTGNLEVADANQTLAADLNEWQGQYAAQYTSTVRTAIKAHGARTTLYFGPDTLGDWDSPPRKEVLQGAAPYLDGLFWLWSGPFSATSPAKYQWATRYLGNKPMMNFMIISANPDSAMAYDMWSVANIHTNTQEERAALWRSIVEAEQGTLSYNNTYQWVGNVWWGLYDYVNEGSSTCANQHVYACGRAFGIRTPSDNAYNAHDAVAGTVACATPLGSYACGNEPDADRASVRPFGDTVTGVAAANALWYSGSAPCSISPSLLGPYTIGDAVNQTFTASAGCAADTWSDSGTWPTGLSFSAGVLSGTVAGSPGTFTLTVSYDTATNNYNITVNAGSPTINNGVSGKTVVSGKATLQ